MVTDKLKESISRIFSGISTRFVIGCIAVSCCFILVFFMLYKPIPEQNKDVVYLAMGLILGYGAAVINYYFGSSKDSSDVNKVDQAKRLTDKPFNE